MVQVKNIVKHFGWIKALDDVSFEVSQGEIVGFLGPNGAGKTTLMRILTSFLPPTKGKALVCGYDVVKRSLAARKNIGYLPETPPLYTDMTVRDYLKFAAKLKSIPQRDLKKKVDKALSDCQISNVSNRTIATLSKGYQQRVGIAQAIIHDPQLLILDEPTTGLDPIQILQVRNLIKNLEYKRTVILSTHILPEIEQIAHRVLIMHQGKIVADQKIENLLKDPETGQKAKLEDVFIKLTA